MYLYILYLLIVMGLIKRTITIREDQEAWLKQQSWINLSGFVQKKLDELIEEEYK